MSFTISQKREKGQSNGVYISVQSWLIDRKSHDYYCLDSDRFVPDYQTIFLLQDDCLDSQLFWRSLLPCPQKSSQPKTQIRYSEFLNLNKLVEFNEYTLISLYLDARSTLDIELKVPSLRYEEQELETKEKAVEEVLVAEKSPATQKYDNSSAIVPIAFANCLHRVSSSLSKRKSENHQAQNLLILREENIVLELYLKNKDRNEQKKNYLYKILFAISYAYAIGVGTWLTIQGYLPFINHSSPSTIALQPQISDADTQFINYMRRSLIVLDRSAKQEETQGNNNEQQTAKIQKRPDVVFVPVYTPTPSNSDTPEIANNLPVVTQSIPMAASILPPPPPPSLPSNLRIIPSKSLQKETIVPQAISQATPVSKPELPAGYTLVGLLQLGKQSTALFEFDRATKQVGLDQVIGDTGWTLKSIDSQAVKISRGAKVRSLEVGDKF